MRLLSCNNDGSYNLTLFRGSIPRYAILSHTWEQEDEEVVLGDVEANASSKTARGIRFNLKDDKRGYAKIRFCAERIKVDQLDYFWVDSCCIDKKSSAELQESITSMFRWYEASDRCYVYLSDVSAGKRSRSSEPLWQLDLHRSRWFKRGWTLQELLAPSLVEFFSRDKTYLGNRTTLERQIQKATNIPTEALRGRLLTGFNMEERLSWADTRKTTKEEDMSYCLMGICGVSMPVLYGEGRRAARRRLELAIESQLPECEHKLSEEKERRRASEEQKDLRRLMDSLRFDEMDNRSRSIKMAHPTTCEWLLVQPSFRQWQKWENADIYRGFFWLKGKPGTGKSTLVNFAKRRMREAFPYDIHVSFFFNRRGVSLERDVFGMYKSLLWQLLNHSRRPQDVFACLDPPLQSNTTPRWTVELLTQLLRFAVQRVTGERMFIFIDALDECDTDEVNSQIQDMIDFLKVLGDEALDPRVTLNIFLSSRHYPTIIIEHGFQLRLEDERNHNYDIESYVGSKLSVLGQDAWAQKVRDDILTKSNGVFLWVVLVVPLLRKEFSDGDRTAIERRLKAVPNELEELFKDIMLRDQHNLDRLRCCLQWIMFAKVPLKPEELRHAILSGTYSVADWDLEPQESNLELQESDGELQGTGPDYSIGHLKPQVWEMDSRYDSEDQADSATSYAILSKAKGVANPDRSAERFVTSSSKGLAEVTDSFEGRYVQLIHESVREYLLIYRGLGKLQIETGVGYALVHDRLKTWCQQYLQRKPVRELPLFQHLGTVPKAHPFLRHAANGLLYHAECAAKHGISQTCFLDNLDLTRYWTHFSEIALRPRCPRHSNEILAMTFHLAMNEYAYLIEQMPAGTVRIGEGGCGCFYPGPLSIALWKRDLPTFMALLGIPVCNSVRDIKDKELRRSVAKLWHALPPKVGDLAIDFLASRSTTSFLLRLLQEGRIRADEITHGPTMKHLVQKGHESLVLTVLRHPSFDTSAKDDSGRSLLWWSAAIGNRAIFDYLLATQHFDMDGRDCYSRSPLVAAASSGSREIVEALLAAGNIDVNATDCNGRTLLSEAIWHKHRTVVDVLLHTAKVDPNVRDEDGNTPLSVAISAEHKGIVGQLLSTEVVDVNLESHGWAPLFLALKILDEDVVLMLLESGKVDLHVRSPYGLTMLSMAGHCGMETAAKLLRQMAAQSGSPAQIAAHDGFDYSL